MFLKRYQVFIIKYVEVVEELEANSDVQAWDFARRRFKGSDCEIVGVSEIPLLNGFHLSS